MEPPDAYIAYIVYINYHRMRCSWGEVYVVLAATGVDAIKKCLGASTLLERRIGGNVYYHEPGRSQDLANFKEITVNEQLVCESGC